MKSFQTIIMILTASFFSLSVRPQGTASLRKGDKAPHFTAYDDNNQLWDIKDHVGKKNIVIFFFPAAMTGGCTKQACSYRDNFKDLEKENALVVGISGDEPVNLQLFRKAYNLNFPLLSDKTGEIARKFGVPLGEGNSITREVDGKEFVLKRGVTARRWTFTINLKGEIIDINQTVDAEHDSQNVLKILQSM